mmetsp:Transcript_52555/g.94337  ORF Transcript_52555/g.94337 Transcript_52555/m.94337 type:complete len:535 (+) Transcript_52555:37-1641(+)
MFRSLPLKASPGSTAANGQASPQQRAEPSQPAQPAEPVDEIDLKQLEAFLSSSGIGNPNPAAAEAVPLPPGFEKGPNLGAYSAAPVPLAPGEVPLAPGAVPLAPGAVNGVKRQDDPRLVGEDTAKVVVETEDPTAAYLAATSWDELNLPKDILDGIFEMGFVKPSKIQEWTLPIALKGGNIIGQAQNGSGKTAAFSLAMLLAVDAGKTCPQGVCICPTRELSVQNHDVIAKLGKFTGLQLYLAVPKEERPPRKVDAQIIVGTPGKLQDFIKKRIIDPKGFKVFVLDEADQMIDEANMMGPQVIQIKNMLPQDLQVLFFSATWPEHVVQFAKTLVPKANTIKVQKEDLTLSTITQTFIEVSSDDQKVTQLSDLYGALNVGQSIIFVNTRAKAFQLAELMKAEGHGVSLICGTQKTGPEKIEHSTRDKVMLEFRNGITKVLISTDVLSRGIDVPAVTLVVNFELPVDFHRRGEPEYETYMHRIGRTGRFGLKGVAVNFVAPNEKHLLDKIKSFYKCNIAQLSGDCEEMEGLLKGLR